MKCPSCKYEKIGEQHVREKVYFKSGPKKG